MKENTFGKEILRLVKLFWGLFVIALGISLTVQAKVGVDPWSVLNTGIQNLTNIKLGTINIGIGIIMVVLSAIFGESIGLGTILNMFLVGIFINGIFDFNILPEVTGIAAYAMLLAGMEFMVLGSYFYMSTNFGGGPRDTFMLFLTHISKKPIGVCRTFMDVTVVIIGWLLGGNFGLGTLIAAFGTGTLVQLTFKLLKFDAAGVKHEWVQQTFERYIKALVHNK